jgi:hypothetical protein
MSINSLCPQGNDFRFAASLEEQDEPLRTASGWISIDELIGTPEEPSIEPDMDMELTIWSSPLLGSDYNWDWPEEDDRPGIALLADGTCIYLDELQELEAVGLRPLCRFKYDDSYMPSFSSNHDKRILNWSEADRKWDRKWRNRKARTAAKFQIDGKRGQKDLRDQRFGNRQEFAERRDYWADVFDIYAEIAAEWNPPSIPTFGIETVGLIKEEASFYEAETVREVEAYERELDWLDWDIEEPDYSRDFAPILNLNQYVWDREENPYRYRDSVFDEFNRIHDIDQRSYHFSSRDHYDGYDDWGWGYHDDSYEDDRHCADDHDDELNHDDGPTLAEWMEMDRLAMERMLDGETEHYTPRFGSTIYKRKPRGYDVDAKLDSKRSKAHTADRGWRRFAPKKHHGRDSIRRIPVWEMHRYNAMNYLTDNARVNPH